MTQARYTNVSAVPLSLAVFLATDKYDHDSTTISATALLKPLRQLILAGRVPENTGLADLTQMVASRVGTAIHDGIENAWLTNYNNAMLSLGIPQRVINNVLINPTEAEVAANPDAIPIYLEQRSYKQVGKYRVGGKFDFVGDGYPEDFKTTGTYTAMNNTNDAKYILQLSIYRWLNPKIITRDEGKIQFIFTDWSSMQAAMDPKYPQLRFQQRILPLMSIPDTEAWVTRKLSDFDDLVDAPEADLPLCTEEELWRSAPKFKYYKGGDATAKRSTKNFDDELTARTFMMVEGKGAGVVISKPGEVKACRYCDAFPVCSQKDALIAAGDLIL